MTCQLQVWNPQSGDKQSYVCDEENAGKMIQEDHGGKGVGSYTDAAGNTFEVDWTTCRLVGFARRRN